MLPVSQISVDLSAVNLGEFSQQWKYALRTENSPALDSDLETSQVTEIHLMFMKPVLDEELYPEDGHAGQPLKKKKSHTATQTSL